MNYTLEIFTDKDAQEPIDTSAALAGVAIFSAHTIRPIILDTTRSLNITKAGSSTLPIDTIRWPRTLPADLNVILTDKPIMSRINEPIVSHTTGTARVTDAYRIAIVNNNQSTLVVSTVVAHEMGHLLEVPAPAGTPEAHCGNRLCIMHASIDKNVAVHTNESNIVKRILRTLGNSVVKSEVTYSIRDEFCSECSTRRTEQIVNIIK